MPLTVYGYLGICHDDLGPGTPIRPLVNYLVGELGQDLHALGRLGGDDGQLRPLGASGRRPASPAQAHPSLAHFASTDYFSWVTLPGVIPPTVAPEAVEVLGSSTSGPPILGPSQGPSKK